LERFFFAQRSEDAKGFPLRLLASSRLCAKNNHNCILFKISLSFTSLILLFKPNQLMKSMLTTCILLCAIVLHAQEPSDSFQIKDYKYRTPGFKALSFDLNFSGGFSKYGIADSIQIKENNFYLSPATFTFYKTLSTDKRIHESNYIFSISGNSSKIKSSNQDVKSHRIIGSFAWLTRDQVFRKNNWFWEYGNYIHVIGQKNNQKAINSDYKFSLVYMNEEAFVGVGKGRIENVSDAQMALFILNDLESQGLIETKGSKEQQLEFARLITDISNQRIFDFRRRRIYELQRIDSFIKQNGLSASTDIRHFTTINDNWIYSFAPFRKNGDQWFFRIRPGIEFRKENNFTKSTGSSSDRTMQNRTISIGPEAGYEAHKAKSLKWQRSFGLEISYKHRFQNFEAEEKMNGTVGFSEKREFQDNWTELNGFYLLGYLPNTRTYITASLGAQLIESPLPFNGKGITFTSFLQFQGSYFLGYRTRLLASLGLSYNNQDIQFVPGEKYQQYGFNTGFNCSITHNIF
jgi:hypothetical protein